MSEQGKGRGRDEAGAVLILALVFLLVVGGVVGSLVTWATNDLNNTTHFTSARSLQYAAESATEVAIQSIRYAPLLMPTPPVISTLNASPPVPCWGSGADSEPPTVDGVNVVVWCSTVWNPASANTRVVTLSTCPVTAAEPLNNASSATNPYLQAVVTFDDYPAGIVTAPSKVPVPCTTYCGTTMTVDSWQWSPQVPIVTGISPASGLITGGTTVSISGTGFVSGSSTVNFIEESGNAPAGNVILPATRVTVNSNVSPPTITAVSPAVIAGSTYFVSVTTPGGTSAYGANDVFTYTVSSVVPAVSSISPNAGSTGGGTPVTITGLGFYAGATVKFVNVSGGASFTATNPTITGPNTITAFAPSVPAVISSYNIEVTTAGGTSATSPVDVFNYSPPIPNPG